MIYISRDLFEDGTLSKYVDVWSEKPQRIKNFDGPLSEVWVSDPEDWLLHKLTILMIKECQELYGVVPDYINELIKAGTYRLPRPKKG